MAVRLRFRCTEKTERANWSGVGGKPKIGSVKLAPTVPPETDPGHAEMKEFYSYTPAGSIEFSTINEEALAQFEIGQDFYITLEAVHA